MIGGWRGFARAHCLRMEISSRVGLTPSTIITMTARTTVPVWSSSSYWDGLGWLIRPSGSDTTWWHGGSLSGTTTIVVRSAGGVTWVAFFNSRPLDRDGFFADLATRDFFRRATLSRAGR
jgi:hypothetical protein